MSDEYVYTVKDVIRPDLTPEARAELCCVVWQTSDTDHIEYVIAEAIRAALSQAQAAAERAEAERDEAYASLTACSEAGIQVTHQKITYRNRALALLRRMSLCRFAHRSNVDIWINAQSRAIAAEARADKLAALLDRAWDYISDNAQHEIQCACVQVAMADCTCKLWPLTADIAAALPTVPDGETK